MKDRLAFKDREERLVQREKEVARREAWIKAREQELATTVAVAKATPAKESNPSFVTSPFRAASKLLNKPSKKSKPAA